MLCMRSACVALQPPPGAQRGCNLCTRNCAGEPCSRASLLMLGSMTLAYIVVFLPQLKSGLALYPAVRLACNCQSQVLCCAVQWACTLVQVCCGG